MARVFVYVSENYLTAAAPMSAEPFTMACWFNVADGVGQPLMCLDSLAEEDFFYLQAQGDEGGDPLRAAAYEPGGGGFQAAVTSSGYSANTWHHGCAVFAANNDRRCFIDGGSKGTNINTTTPVDVNTFTIGALVRDSGVFGTNGKIAEAAIWNAALTDEEVAILALGVSPLLVRPQNLITYVPLIRDEDEDIVGGLSFTAVDGPTIGTHSRVFYIVSPVISHLSGEEPPIEGEVTWGHDTGVIEVNIRDFTGNWTGDGAIAGAGDAETLQLETTENMVSEVVDTGTYTVSLFQNLYDGTGDDVDMDYRHGATKAACEGAGWNNYVGSFVSLGYVQIKMTSTL